LAISLIESWHEVGKTSQVGCIKIIKNAMEETLDMMHFSDKSPTHALGAIINA
jgi:hypothetical protein